MEIRFKKVQPGTIEMQKKVVDQLTNNGKQFESTRSALDKYDTVGDGTILIPTLPLPMEILEDAAKFSDVLRTIHFNLKREILRNGYEVKENFAMKCTNPNCEKEFENPVDDCDECGGTDLREPDMEQKKLLVKYGKNMNDNEQELLDVSGELNDDMESFDDAYLLCVTEYYWKSNGELLLGIPVEFVRMDPKYVRIIADKKGRPGYNASGDRVVICPVHRDEIHYNVKSCGTCGRKMESAYFRSEEPEGKYIYYTKDEVCHKSKYNPTLTYGFSNILSVWYKVTTLMAMDKYMQTYYTKQRPPRGLLFVDTPNMGSLEKYWKWMLDQFKINPHQIPPFGVERAEGARGNMVQFIDFMKSMDEMQFIDTRNEMRRQIGAEYGVMPLFQADISSGGGLNNEGLQVTVTDRAVEFGQGIYNDKFFPWIQKKLDVTDFHYELNPNKEQDKAHIEDLRQKRITNARMMQEMGFDVLINEEEEFEFDPIDEHVEKPSAFGGAPMFGQPGSSETGTKPEAETKTPVPTSAKPKDMIASK